jgi:membrane protease YdiL (CAAX protease family)
MIVGRYSLFRNWKLDMAYIVTFSAISFTLYVIPPSSYAGNFINIVILAPFVEEYFFRGFMLGLVYDRAMGEIDRGIKIAALAAAISVSLGGFMIMHTMTEYLYSFIYGFYFTLIFIAYRSLKDSRISKFAALFSVIPHFLNNSIVFLFNVTPLVGQIIPVGSVFVILIIWSLLISKKNFNRMTKDDI